MPPQHVIVYDEAQRAWDVEQVAAKHALPFPVSEPEAFVGFGERIPGWCVLVGLIGSGQEIDVGEEAGLGQWRAALEQAGDPGGWTVHAPEAVLREFFAGDGADGTELAARTQSHAALELTVELRFHFRNRPPPDAGHGNGHHGCSDSIELDMTAADLTTIDELIRACEDEQCEFKAARSHFDFSKLADYCAALSNEGGGILVLGLSDSVPRHALGTQAFRSLQKTVADVTQQLRIKVSARESVIDGKRVLTFRAPAHPIGQPVAHNGRFLMRGGEALLPMTVDQIKRIVDETVSDFSATLVHDATRADLHPEAVTVLRRLWARRSGDRAVSSLSDEQILEDLGLTVDGEPTVAALVLLARPQSLARLLAQAEIVFEYRSRASTLRYQQRLEFRRGFLLCHDDIWEAVNARNDVHQIQEGMLVRDIAMFSEAVVREAILNALAHRDYSRTGSIFIRQAPDILEVVSPGGLPRGITIENMLWRQDPRNRRIADVLERCGLVDRSGQGIRRMLESCIRESKPRPDYSQTDDHQVTVVLSGAVRNPLFLRFLERIGEETLRTFSTRDFMSLDVADKGEKMPADLRPHAHRLAEVGVLESVGRGAGTRYVLSRRYYQFADAPGTYTRKRGLDQETNKQLLLKHVNESGEGGSPLIDLRQVLPALSKDQVQYLLKQLRREGFIVNHGRTRAGRWYAVGSGPDPD